MDDEEDLTQEPDTDMEMDTDMDTEETETVTDEGEGEEGLTDTPPVATDLDAVAEEFMTATFEGDKETAKASFIAALNSVLNNAVLVAAEQAVQTVEQRKVQNMFVEQFYNPLVEQNPDKAEEIWQRADALVTENLNSGQDYLTAVNAAGEALMSEYGIQSKNKAQQIGKPKPESIPTANSATPPQSEPPSNKPEDVIEEMRRARGQAAA